MSGSPQIVIRDGKIDQTAMADLRLSLDDLMTALRGKDIFDVTQVQFAVLETNGGVSVYPKAAYQPVTCGDLRLVGDGNDNPPEILIADGCVSREGMAAAGYNDAKLQKTLQKHHVSPAEVFLLTVGSEGEHLVRKERTGT